MKTSQILVLLRAYITLSIKILVPISIIFLIGYFIIYKKILKGTKTIKKRQFLLYAISLCYIVIVIGATFLSRTPSETYNDKMNLNLFSSYIEAYHDIGVVLLNNVLLRNLILNVILFIPLGFLLPMYSSKLKKMYIVVPIGLLTTLTIEFTQHFHDYGTFEIDDAFNNTLGTLIGYCIFMIIYKLRNKENWKKIIGYAIPIIATIGLFAGILIGHRTQEFGNFDFENNFTIDMSNVNVQSEIEFSNERSVKEIYQTEIATKEEARQIAVEWLKKVGAEVDDSQTGEGENMVLFRNKTDNLEQSYFVNIDYVGVRDTFSDSSYIYVKDGNIVFMPEIKDASKEEVEQALTKLDVKVPEYAEFGQNQGGQYTFTVNMKKEGNKLIDGELKCRYYEDKTIKRVEDEIITYEKVAEKEIMSEQEAYEEILAGEFKAFSVESVQSITIQNMELEYRLDSKGFYVPVYKFDILLNGETSWIYIKAVK